MKAIAALRSGVAVVDIEKPKLLPGHVGVRTEYSAISPGTELGMIRGSLDDPRILGYSAVGIVEQVGEGAHGFREGQRVACYGAPYTCHAQWLSVPANLAAVVPEHVDAREAAYAGLGAIAIHALRTARLAFGESVIVVGLGILGNLIAQIAHAAAYRTIALDVDAGRADMLRKYGLSQVYDNREKLVGELEEATGGGVGADAVLLCAGGSGSGLIDASLSWLRDRGKIVVVGDLYTEFNRGLMFAKEAQVLISRAGGPGRYDERYERDNVDYPVGYVRWTEGRNTSEYIRLLAERRISVQAMITHEYALDDCERAYGNYSDAVGAIGTLFRHGD
ncbi:alcohol dehydrogenase [Paenibacillus sp. MY03]|uniref:zinc-dependent alcohol dehydrogenase n=1 Tax=Paenibacillus sp. MY03 TaxID=302980 RepID=UPI000B3C5BDA|nr:zinc-binding alcohol dehydrogenase [Paenibacillus sp. MY03]OUS74807.1 alcohol dehydrogenase [Paenibacillus sp. MY03]